MLTFSKFSLVAMLLIGGSLSAFAGDGYPTSNPQGPYTDSGPTSVLIWPGRGVFANDDRRWDRQQRRANDRPLNAMPLSDGAR